MKIKKRKSLKKPPRLVEGDVIGLVSPSSGMAGSLPGRTERGIEMIRSLGFKVKLGRNALLSTDYTAGTPQQRASDLNNMVKDPKVKAIVSFIGGNHSNQLLPYLDFDLFRSNPKILLGYSDTTVLQLAYYTVSGVVTFSGPAVLTQFAENPEILPYTLKWFQHACLDREPIGLVEPAARWTDEILDWYTGADLKRPRRMKRNNGYEWLRGGKSSGKLIGGCITSIMHLRGTRYWPNLDGSILFWEVPEGADFTKGEDVSYIDAHLTDLLIQGALDKLSGMVIGRPFGYTAQQTKQLVEVVKRVTKGTKFPILFNADFGHSDPMLTIPIGVKAVLDSRSNRFEIVERGTSG